MQVLPILTPTERGYEQADEMRVFSDIFQRDVRIVSH
jgi:hypothetical protein